MKSVNFVDWSELALKKDIENINKKLDSQEPIFLSVCIEIVIAVGVILIDHLFDISTIPWYVWLITGLIAILPPFVLIIVALVKYIKKIIHAVKGKYNITKYVDMFDNSICYWVMMSKSFCDLLKDENKILSKEEKMFYFQEANYYINKSIYELDEMTPIADKIFSNKNSEILRGHVISVQRFEVILNLLKSVRSDLKENSKSFGEYENCKEKQIEINLQYDKMMISFIKKINACYNCTYKWNESQ